MLEMLRGMSAGDLLVAAFFTVVGMGALGLITNMVMRQAGFGIVINGLLVTIGLVAGVQVHQQLIGY